MDAHKISHAPRLSAEAAIWKEPRSDPLAHLAEAFRDVGGYWDSLGDKPPVAAILGSAGKSHAGILCLNY